MLHTPVQHSGPEEHASPSCEQKETALEQRPPAHRCEQQSESFEHVLLNVKQVWLSDAQVPPVHWVLQQSEFAPQD
jgi:hypothetical protein